MGREIKRIALDFDYPINQMIWKGYHNPYTGLECKVCEGRGESPEIKRLSEDWYGVERPENKWCYKITQDEVQALVDEGRLRDFAGCVPEAEEVNQWAQNGFGHDAINQWICVKARAKRLGIENFECSICDGEGSLWPDDKYKNLAEEYEFIDPPSGDGYQLWTTTTEGTPMSPVFSTPEKLAKWLEINKASSFGSDTATYDQWLKFIKGPGWAPSMISGPKGIKSGVEYSGRLANEN